jgi:succinoglycan biosynthesis protein ExoM
LLALYMLCSDFAMMPMDVSICICAYKRPKLLNILLEEMQAQRDVNLEIEIVVADNDPEQSSTPVLEYWSKHSRFPLTALHVPTPNIALARNACVQVARGAWVAFIDDDERPEPDWLINLFEACRKFDADAAFGPVLPILPDEAPAWIVEGGFSSRRRHTTGTSVGTIDTRTGNALVLRDLLTQSRQPFDPEFGRTGGSDHVLFSRLLAEGAHMIWVDEAIVHEYVPPERTTLQWLVRRSFRTGQVATRTRLLHNEIHPEFGRRAIIATRAGGNFAACCAVAILRAPVSKTRAIRAALDAASYLGRFLAVFGHRYEEYRH